jgi:hypothetical protein
MEAQVANIKWGGSWHTQIRRGVGVVVEEDYGGLMMVVDTESGFVA